MHKILKTIGHNLMGFVELRIMKIYKDKEIINLIKKHVKYINFKPSEFFLIYSISKAQKKINGEYAEVGVYKGLSAEIICKNKGKKSLYLFDTFSGLPETEKIDKGYKKNQFQAKFEKIKEKFEKYENVFIYKGLFPETSNPIKNKKFAFIHLDVNLYKSTKESLEFFYNRMEQGGIILSHDYAQAKGEGVKKAFDDFFMDKPEVIIELPLSQCMVMKK